MYSAKGRLHRAIAGALCALFTFSGFTGGSAYAASSSDYTDLIDTTNMLADSDVLFNGFVNKQFGIVQPNSKLPQPSSRRALDDATQVIYDMLSSEIKKVANGTTSSTVFKISLNDVRSQLNVTGNVSYSLKDLINALLNDYPYELFWYDKTAGVSTITSYYSVEFSFPVSVNYSESGSARTTKTNAEKIASASKAAKNAAAVLDGIDPNWSDYKVLTYFKDEICKRVSYNTSAAQNTNTKYGDPWQLIYVFDDDTNTNVVCEGYSKAFKYLCDMYDFHSDISCDIITGQMATYSASGGHMWNSVKINDKYYLADVTNSDFASIGSSGGLFIAGVPESGRLADSDGTFVGAELYPSSQKIRYVYDESTMTTFTKTELDLALTSPELHTVLWKNDNGDILETDLMVADGEHPFYNGSTPRSDSGSFSGWSPEYNEKTVISGGDETIVFTAMYSTENEKKEYVVNYNVNGTVELSENVEQGRKAESDFTPEIEGCNFEGWYTDSNFENEFSSDSEITSDVELYAKFTCPVTWVNFDGTVLAEDNVLYGSTPNYAGEEPERPASVQYSYTFVGWSPELSAAEGPDVYTANFSETLNTFTVLWKNYDGTILETDENVPYGEMPEYNGETPKMKSDSEKTYAEFSGWSPEVLPVTDNAEYTAVFTDVVKTFTVTWKNADGSVIEVDENVEYGETPGFDGETPDMPDTEGETYTFVSWSDDITQPIHENKVFTAVFESQIKTFKVTWKNWNGDVLSEEEVEYNSVPEYEGTDPARPEDESFVYSFSGWSPEISSVKADIVYTAQFSKEERKPDLQPDTPDTPDIPEPVKRKLGDVNNDGTIDSNDAVIILRSSVGIDRIPEELFVYADMDRSLEIDSFDALLALRYSVAIDDGLGIGEYI